MKPIIPYILIVAVLLVAGGIFLQISSGGEQILPVSFIQKDAGAEPMPEDGNPFKNYGPAPDFAGITKWLNSEALTQEQLKGKVVLIDFWTYSCINCIRTLPYILDRLP
jgi:thiol-disulfide isomerase/thioredoxin